MEVSVTSAEGCSVSCLSCVSEGAVSGVSRLGSSDQGELFFMPGSDRTDVSAPGREADKTGKCIYGFKDRSEEDAMEEEGEGNDAMEEEDAKTEAAEYCCPQAKGIKQIVRIHSPVTLFFISSP